jgi:hypothetical protein
MRLFTRSRYVRVAVATAAVLAFSSLPSTGAVADPVPVAVTEIGPLGVVSHDFTGCSGFSCSGPTTAASPTYDSNRDCGYSTQVEGNRYLWVFCDTDWFHRSSPTATPEKVSTYFINSGGGITTGSDPTDVHTTTIDDQPWAFISPSPSGPCDEDYPGSYYSAWPQSATKLDSETDLDWFKQAVVVVMFQQFCVRPGSTDPAKPPFEGRSTGIAFYSYEGAWSDAVPPAAPYGGFGIQGTVLNYDLFHNTPNVYGYQFGLSEAGGYLYADRCDQVHACEAARVAINGDWNSVDKARLADTTSWQYQEAAGTWHAFDGTTKAPTTTTKYLWSSGSSPVSDPAIVFNPNLGKYVLTYMTVGFSEKAAIRTASSPTGPWSAPVDIALPANCLETVDPTYQYNGCYQVIPHPEMDADGQMGLTYYDVSDMMVDNGGPALQPTGRIHVGTVPYSALP